MCRQELGFCIPGFQVYKISNKRLLRYGKEYGKKLTKDGVTDGKSEMIYQLFMYIGTE